MYNHDFLQDLWYSGIHPQREAEKEFPDLLSQARIRKEAENEFIESLSEEQKERFHHYKSLVEFEDRMRQEGAFRSGFRLGAGLMEEHSERNDSYSTSSSKTSRILKRT